MLTDARALASGTILDADVCIVGAGAAGITLAREFAGAEFRVILLEGGGLTFEHRSQFLNRGQLAGHSSLPLDATHRRQFGGTTAVWFGRCRPLEALDFESRPWVPYSGWPFSAPDLDTYYARAGAVCELEAHGYDPQDARLAGVGLEDKLFRFSPPTHFGETYFPLLRSAANMHLVVHANASSLTLDDAGTAVTGVRCATLNGKRLLIRARHFILAGGGLENPRLLLNSRDVHTRGLGNLNDLVGRFFMEHAETFVAVAERIPADFPSEYLQLNYESFQRRLSPTPAIGLPDSRLRELRLLSSGMFFVRRPLHKTDDRFYSRRLRGFLELVETLQHRRPPTWAALAGLGKSVVHSPTIVGLMSKALMAKLAGESEYALQLQTETVPNPESRVTLIDRKDALGINQIRLDWRLSAQDLDSFRRSQTCLLDGLTGLGISIRELHHDLDPEGWPVCMLTSRHHMGTTRMNRDARLGVVDANCRVHGIPNLYVAGSSVFPTSGMANPTLTIVALAVRLADHVKQVLN